eukprot:12130700-Alexandrium_andersonii.AAC.1
MSAGQRLRLPVPVLGSWARGEGIWRCFPAWLFRFFGFELWLVVVAQFPSPQALGVAGARLRRQRRVREGARERRESERKR